MYMMGRDSASVREIRRALAATFQSVTDPMKLI